MQSGSFASAISSPYRVPITRLNAASCSPSAPVVNKISPRRTAARNGIGTVFNSAVSSDATASATEPTPQDDALALLGLDSDDTTQCNCRQSRCIKMYCDCFAKGKYCSASCKCVGCVNHSTNEASLHRSRQSISKRNPSAFSHKVSSQRGTRRHSQGCKCSKSRCQKRYCECFNAGVQCTSSCQCQNCCNGRESFGELPVLDRDGGGEGLFDAMPMDPFSFDDDTRSTLPMPSSN